MKLSRYTRALMAWDKYLSVVARWQRGEVARWAVTDAYARYCHTLNLL